MNRYLLIDDDDIITKIHPVIIRRVDKECEIEICVSGVQAIDYLNALQEANETAPDYIFLDINMPVMTGFEFMEALSQSLTDFISNSKIILLSSSVDPRDIEKAANYKTIIEFAPKPLTIDYIQNLLSAQ